MAYPISLSILGGTTIDLCEHSNSLCKINNWLLGIIVGGIAVITIVYFFTVFFVLMRRGRQFRKMNNDIVREYHENKNGELFLEKLLAIDTKPKDMKDEMTWYLNIATAFNVLGKRNECIALFKQLEEVATEKDKEYIQNSIKFVQEQLEK